MGRARRDPRPRLRVIRNGLRDLMCRRCGATEGIVQVDWVPVEYPVTGVRADGTVVVENLEPRVTIDWEGADLDHQELRCRSCGHRWRVPDEVAIEVTHPNG